MMKGGHGQTNQLHDINWGALDHASHATQCSYCIHILAVLRVCLCVVEIHYVCLQLPMTTLLNFNVALFAMEIIDPELSSCQY